MIERHLGDGFFPSVTWDGTTAWCAWQAGSKLVVASFVKQFDVVEQEDVLVPLQEYRWPLAAEALAFPVIARTAGGDLVVAYRDGSPYFAINLRIVTRGEVEPIALHGGGNKPCAISPDYVAWQDAGFGVWRRGLLGGVSLWMRPGAPTGLSRLRDDGWPVLWDEDYTSIPGMTAPSFAGPATVGEHPAGGVTGSWAGLTGSLHLWPGDDTRTPSAAYSAATDRVAVVTWGNTGIRLGIVGPEDVQVQPPAPMPVVGRPCWLAWFVFSPALQPPPPRNAALVVAAEMLLRDERGQVVAQYVQGSPDSDVDSLEREIARAKQQHPTIPVLAYWTQRAQAVRVPHGADWVGVEAYQGATEPIVGFEARVRAAVARVSTAVLIAQVYTSNSGNTADLASLVPVYARIARDCQDVTGIVAFSAGARPTGYDDHPEVHAAWAELFAGIPGPPAIITLPVPPEPPPIPPPEPPPEDPVKLTFWPFNEDHIETEILAPLAHLEQTYFGQPDVTHGAFGAWVLGFRGVQRHAFDVVNERFGGVIPADGEMQRKIIQAGYRRMMLDLIAAYPQVPDSEVPPDPLPALEG